MYKYHQPWWLEFKEISIFANKVWQLNFLFHIKLTTECQSVKTMQFTRIICITQVKMVVYKFLGILGKTKHQVKKSQKQVLLHVKCSEVFRTVTKYSSTMLSWNFRIFCRSQNLNCWIFIFVSVSVINQSSKLWIQFEHHESKTHDYHTRMNHQRQVFEQKRSEFEKTE